MPIDQRLTVAKARLSDEVNKIIDESSQLSKEQKRPIASGPYKNHFVVADFFDSVILDATISKAICDAVKTSNASKSLKNSFKHEPADASLGWLIRNSKTILKAQEVVLIAIKYFRRRVYDDSLITSIGNKSEINYLKELHFHLGLIINLVKSSKMIKRRTVTYSPDFCELCWRLVNKSETIRLSGHEDDKNQNYSMRYCLEHHPKKSATKYYRDRSAIVSAFDRLDDEFKDNIIYINKCTKQNYISLSQIISKFAPRTIIKDFNGHSWKDCANSILQTSKEFYPSAYEKINNVSIDKLPSWKDWFLAVIQELDTSSSKSPESPESPESPKSSKSSKSSNSDISNWNDTCIAWKLKSDEQDFTKDLVGWGVLLNVLRRYEAVSKINEIKSNQKASKRITPIKNKIIELVNEQKEKHNKITVSKISKQLNISRAYVYNVIKELNLL
ncbi:helix-turn-helix domain-containing protein [Aeromonas caviae]|uniref:Helix-turn-helix domain-containing protein n=3 Tax=Aeromonas caviae TaxID=648 RepID=A0AA42VF13_AERCA|nr:helix-turn-helix domain-containing protein [Aeromonas caviae]